MRRPQRDVKGIELPLVAAGKLWHIGSLDIRQRGARGQSLEGNLFSVSACPLAWRSIAKLGGAPLHESNQAVLLLNILEALESPAFQPFRDEVTRYGLESGLLRQAEVYKAIRFDDELDSECYSLHESLEKAQQESDDVEPITMLLCTEQLKQIHSLPGGVTPGLEYAMIEWLRDRVPALPESGCTPIAGVYWDEDYAPRNYSAPRGGLFSSAFAAMSETPQWPSDKEGLALICRAEPASLAQLVPKQTLTLYHGTNAQFDTFSLDHPGSGTGTSVGRLGIWLAPCPIDAGEFGSTVLTVEADWKKPYTMGVSQLSGLHKESGLAADLDQFFDEQRQRLLGLGYDSIAVLELDGRARSVIALRPDTLRIVDRSGPTPEGPQL